MRVVRHLFYHVYICTCSHCITMDHGPYYYLLIAWVDNEHFGISFTNTIANLLFSCSSVQYSTSRVHLTRSRLLCEFVHLQLFYVPVSPVRIFVIDNNNIYSQNNPEMIVLCRCIRDNQIYFTLSRAMAAILFSALCILSDYH